MFLRQGQDFEYVFPLQEPVSEEENLKVFQQGWEDVVFEILPGVIIASWPQTGQCAGQTVKQIGWVVVIDTTLRDNWL